MRKILLTTALLLFSSGAIHAEETGDHEINLVVNAPEPEISLNLFGNTNGGITSTDLNFDDFNFNCGSTGGGGGAGGIGGAGGGGAGGGGSTGCGAVELGTLAFNATGLPATSTQCRVAIQSTRNWTLVNETATQSGAGQPGRPIPYTIHANSSTALALNSGGINPAEVSANVTGNACSYSAPLYFRATINYTPEAGTYTDTLTFTSSVI